MEKLFDITINRVLDEWEQPRGLFFAVLLLVAFLSQTLPPLIGDNQDALIAVTLFFVVVIVLYWNSLHLFPKVTAGKLGFVVSIFCDGKDTYGRVRNDFILPLKATLKSGGVGSSFDFIEVRQRQASLVIDKDEADQLRRRYGAQFILYGRARDRSVGNSPSYVVDLSGVVAHRPIAIDVSNKLASEFSELLPRQVIVNKDVDVLSFQFASELADVVSKYIIGIAAAISGDLDYAESVYLECLRCARRDVSGYHVFEKIKLRVPDRLAEIYRAKANNSYECWLLTYDQFWIEGLGQYLRKIEELGKQGIGSRFLEAIYEFLGNKDDKRAAKALDAVAKSDRDALWHLNYAFLYAYGNNLKKATQHYNSALRHATVKNVLEDHPYLIMRIEEFLHLVVSREPGRGHLWFCLGFINWKFKSDCRLACLDFERFLAATEQCGFETERDIARKWIIEIRGAKSANDPQGLEYAA